MSNVIMFNGFTKPQVDRRVVVVFGRRRHGRSDVIMAFCRILWACFMDGDSPYRWTDFGVSKIACRQSPLFVSSRFYTNGCSTIYAEPARYSLNMMELTMDRFVECRHPMPVRCFVARDHFHLTSLLVTSLLPTEEVPRQLLNSSQYIYIATTVVVRDAKQRRTTSSPIRNQ